MKIRLCGVLLLMWTGTVILDAQTKRVMFDPLFGIRYDPQLVKFQEAPPKINQLCSFLRDRKLWLYAEYELNGTQYYIVSGFVVYHPDGPGKGDIAPAEDGVAVATRGNKCTVYDADWVMSGEVDPKNEADLPETYPEDLPGYGAPSICDSAGTCHYSIRSREAEKILTGLSRDALERYSRAFGSKEGFLKAFQANVRHPDLLAPVLRDQLAEFESSQGVSH